MMKRLYRAMWLLFLLSSQGLVMAGAGPSFSPDPFPPQPASQSTDREAGWRSPPKQEAISPKRPLVQEERPASPWWGDILVWVAWTGGVLGGVLGLSLFWNRRLSREIAQRKRTEAKMEAAMKAAEAANQAKSLFLANMSHELRTPLNAILGFSQQLSKAPELSEGHRESIHIIKRSGEHLLQLINDILEMSKIETGRMELNCQWFDLGRFVDEIAETIQLQARGKGLRFRLSRDPDLPVRIQADERRLRQVLINLLGNAVKFTRAGEVRFEIASGRADFRSDCTLGFRIQDTGIGIPENQTAAVFKPFFQLHSNGRGQEGTGLGLSISQRLVRLMGGEIQLQNETDNGVSVGFEIRVPCSCQGLASSRSAREPTYRLAPGQSEYRILVVEDEPISAMLIKNLMQKAGFSVRTASNGREAVNRFEQFQPHLIWMDIHMPAMDGIEATQAIRAAARGDQTAIVALSAAVYESDRQNALAAGCDGVVEKPFKEAELFDSLARHLGVRFLSPAPAESALPESALPESEGPQAGGNPPCPERDFAEVPAPWKKAFHQSVITGNAENVLALIRQIQDTHPELARQLTVWVREFRYDRLIALATGACEDE